MIENSEVMKKVLTTLINVSNRRAASRNVVSIMDSLITKLEGKYDFLKHVEIKDIRFSEAADLITVMSDLNNVSPTEVGKAIHEIIFSINESLGRDAGFYFIKEIGHRIGDECCAIIRYDMDVNLNIMQSEWDVSRMERKRVDLDDA